MGTHQAITSSAFPKQGGFLAKHVSVCFHYDTANFIGGVVVRDDMEEPFETIIKLDDGRFVRAVECQYTTT